MKLTLAKFAQLENSAAVVIHSLDQALYQVTVIVGDEPCLLVENSGRTFKCHSLQQARDALQSMPVASIVLRHQSPYDEMVGQPVRQQDNTLEVTVSHERYPPPVTH